jgi:hypothetical protein
MPKPTTPNLVQFARARRRKGCPVCALPKEVRMQLIDARGKKIPRVIMMEWLNKELGHKITDEQLTTHAGGRHDSEEI